MELVGIRDVVLLRPQASSPPPPATLAEPPSPEYLVPPPRAPSPPDVLPLLAPAACLRHVPRSCSAPAAKRTRLSDYGDAGAPAPLWDWPMPPPSASLTFMPRGGQPCTYFVPSASASPRSALSSRSSSFSSAGSGPFLPPLPPPPPFAPADAQRQYIMKSERAFPVLLDMPPTQEQEPPGVSAVLATAFHRIMRSMRAE